MAEESPEAEATASNAPPYEELIAGLEDVVERLEGGGLSLEEAMAAYEKGVAVAEQAQRLLDSAEQRIEQLRSARAPTVDDDADDA